MEDQKNRKIFRKQPILCPWITSQPYHSSLWNKNRSLNQNDPALANRFLNNPWMGRPLGPNKTQDRPLPSIQQSSSQFFYFLRLMQLFPDTHPATLHSVLTLCKNDFFCAVDKLLYAKRCKLLCYKKSLVQKNPQNRSRSVCTTNGGMILKNDANVIVKQIGKGGRYQNGGMLNLTIAGLDEGRRHDVILTRETITSEPAKVETITTHPLELSDNAEDLSTFKSVVDEELSISLDLNP